MEPDRLPLLVELAKVVAWPLTVVISILIFRPQIRSLLKRVKRGRVGSAEIEFEDAVRELPQSTSPPDPLWFFAECHPVDASAAVLEAWLGVEDAARRLALKLGLPASLSTVRAPALARILQEKRALTRDNLDLFRELRSARNQATVDAFHPSAESVLRYLRAAAGLRSTIERAVQS